MTLLDERSMLLTPYLLNKTRTYTICFPIIKIYLTNFQQAQWSDEDTFLEINRSLC